MHLAIVKAMLLDISSLISICEDEGSTATLWLVAATVVGVLTAFCPILVKLFQKLISDSENKKIWKIRSTWLLIIGGLLPTALFLFLAYYLGRDFRDCVSGPGFFLGLLVASLSYLAAVILGHLLTPWRRELIGR
ncbi:MAG TPA: hypothetical protein VN256_06890 [Pyrinomonadaceae bacterium]|nr:hypothetical protein [Pyrinomonadaceae bacterium]